MFHFEKHCAPVWWMIETVLDNFERDKYEELLKAIQLCPVQLH